MNSTRSKSSFPSTLATGLALLLAAGLQACGGGGGGADSASPGGPGGSTSGSVAGVDSSKVPNAAGVVPLQIHATNRGLYLLAIKAASGGAIATMQVAKLHGNPQFNDWTTADFDAIQDFAPVNDSSEADRAFSFYWAGFLGGEQRWGIHSQNNGVPSLDFEDDLGVFKVAAGGTQTANREPWLLNMGAADGIDVRMQDNGSTAANTVSDQFGAIAGNVPVQRVEVRAHESSPQLFVGVGSALKRFSSGKLEGETNLSSFGSGEITQLSWAEGTLWIGYGDKVLRRGSDGTISLVLTQSLPNAGNGFCVNGGYVLGADGSSYQISTGQSHDFISSGTLSAEQSAKALLIRSYLAGGIYCSSANSAHVVYGVLGDTVYMIEPLK